MKKLRCYLDFDGTATSLAGGPVVCSIDYQRLQKQTDSEVDYDAADFIDFNQMVERIKKFDKLMQVKPDFIEFLKKFSDADIVIVSKNRKEYILASLVAAGLADEIIQKITIYDVKSMQGKNKGYIVAEHENTHPPADVIVVGDDNGSDFTRMTNALANSSAIILPFTGKAGEINFDTVTKDVNQQLQSVKKTPDEKSETSHTNSSVHAIDELLACEKKYLLNTGDQVQKHLDKHEMAFALRPSASRSQQYLVASCRVGDQRSQYWLQATGEKTPRFIILLNDKWEPIETTLDTYFTSMLTTTLQHMQKQSQHTLAPGQPS